jgi:hypothetical protein
VNTAPRADILAFHLQNGPMSDPGAGAKAFVALPKGVAALAGVVPGLLLHQHVGPSYGAPVSPARQQESQVRPLAAMLEEIVRRNPAPLAVERPLEERFVCVCRHFSLMLVAMLRSQGIPARARCGFGAYFERGKFVDHWVAEYWNAKESRWVLVDAQMDARQTKLFRLDFDPLDVPRDRFIIAGDAWVQCRDGNADPAAFGILDMHGLWFIAGNVVRDFAALNGMEMLPWDCWGVTPLPGTTLDAEQIAFYDGLAALTRDPDAQFDALRKRYDDEQLRVPPVVFNAVMNREERV